MHNSKIIKLSSILKKYNFLHYLLKKIYFRISYILFADKQFKYEIINGLEEKLNFDKNTEYFFGYYHNTPWSYDDRFLLINSILDKENININIIDTYNSKIVFTATTNLWNFQTGAMLGWMPNKHVIYYNKLIDGVHKTVLYDFLNKETSYFDFPIQCVHPNENHYLSINYSNLYEINRDYGYKNKCSKMSEYDNGVWKCYFDEGIKAELLISEEDMKTINNNYIESTKHEFNHCLFSNDGAYFIFIYRYLYKGIKYSKLILSNYKSSKIKTINDLFVSHMCWIDSKSIFYFGDSIDGSKGYYIYNLLSDKTERVMCENLNDGHPSIDSKKKWIVLDSYPDKKHNCHLYIYNLKTKEVINIGRFKSDINLYGYNRCDLHPRWNNSGDKIMIDSSHLGKRNPVIINLRKIIHEK